MKKEKPNQKTELTDEKTEQVAGRVRIPFCIMSRKTERKYCKFTFLVI